MARLHEPSSLHGCTLRATSEVMNAITGNDSVTALVRRHDPDRFLTALFAPAERRDALMTLYGFNHELARAPEVASQPMLALIRLQWWREVVEGVPKRHEIASPLSDAIAAGLLDPIDLLAMIEAREREVEDTLETFEDWQAWLWQGAGTVSVAAARLLGAAEPELFRRFGAAYGGAGVLRSVSILARAGRCLLPLDRLAVEGLSPEAAIAAAQIETAGARLLGHAGDERDRASEAAGNKAGLDQAAAVSAPERAGWPAATSPSADFANTRSGASEAVQSRLTDRTVADQKALGRVLDRLAGEVGLWLGSRSRVRPRAAIAAALPGTLARRDLKRVNHPWQPRGLGDRLAAAAGALTGRV